MGDTSDSNPPSTSCTVNDFMLHAHNVAAAAASCTKTFGELAEMILNKIVSHTYEAKRTDAVFDLYQESSIKAEERLRRT